MGEEVNQESDGDPMTKETGRLDWLKSLNIGDEVVLTVTDEAQKSTRQTIERIRQISRLYIRAGGVDLPIESGQNISRDIVWGEGIHRRDNPLHRRFTACIGIPSDPPPRTAHYRMV